MFPAKNIILYTERDTHASEKDGIFLSRIGVKKPGTLGTMGTRYKKHSIFNGFSSSRFL
jgi:hypothetical protein